jgi:hypothetical protein
MTLSNYLTFKIYNSSSVEIMLWDWNWKEMRLANFMNKKMDNIFLH